MAKANITCPNCQHESAETLPGNACVFFFECPSCKTVLRPKAGDCCVFCSYGDQKCPSRLLGIPKPSSSRSATAGKVRDANNDTPA